MMEAMGDRGMPGDARTRREMKGLPWPVTKTGFNGLCDALAEFALVRMPPSLLPLGRLQGARNRATRQAKPASL